MSIFNELLPKLFDISNNSSKNFNDELEAALECLGKFEEEYQNGRAGARERAQRDKTLMTTLQSIHEDDDEPNKAPESAKPSATKSNDDDKTESSSKRRVSKKQPVPKKRSKDEVEDMSSPEQEKRQKRNASVKAQSIITKQVNVNLTQKLRRENSMEKKSRRKDGEDKENDEPTVPMIQIKQEKISLPPEPMDTEILPLNVDIKQEQDKDGISMPPPLAPVPKPRKALQKDKPTDDSVVPADEETGRRRNTRTKKQLDAETMPPPAAPVPSARATRASSRASSRATRQLDAEEAPPPEPRPKRTRAKKKVSETSSTEAEKTQTLEETGLASPAEKPRPKRTRRGKNAEKEAQKLAEQKETEATNATEKQISPKEERISQPDSPVLQKPKKNNKKTAADEKTKKLKENQQELKENQLILKEKQQNKRQSSTDDVDSRTMVLDETKVILKQNLNVTVTLNGDMDKTMVLPNGVYSHTPVTPQSIRVNETMVIEACTRETMVIEKANINDATVVLDKEPKPVNITDDNSSLLTDDGSETEARTPPKPIPSAQPTSAVKEKVQQFEELAARTTRTKTRAMAKMEDQDNQTPPDKISKPILSQETLNKMNSMIFNGKPPQVSSSASKPRAIIPPPKSQPASTSKLSALSRHKEAAEETLKWEKEDARKKKEAMLEAKREQQRKKREEKMAAAAAARDAAERERRLAAEAAARGRQDRQLHADMGRMQRMRDVERKKQELARKVAETEERRRAEEQARQQRLADEQRKAEAARRKQLEEAEAMKKEAALVAKEIEKRQKEYLEKQKLKHLNDKHHTPHKTPGTPGYHPMEPVYMADGFQYLNSDEEDDQVQRPVPAWSASKARKLTLAFQSQVSQPHIDALFSVRVHSPDLRDIFPAIERARLKRTSSAVWRTPPAARLPTLQE